MRKLLLFLFFVSISRLLVAQDIIVMVNNDSIRCNITKVQDNVVYYSLIDEENVTGIIPMHNVKECVFNAYQLPVKNTETQIKQKKAQRFRLALDVGYGYHLGRVLPGLTADMQKYVKKLKSGLQMEGAFAYYLTEHIGVGLKGDFFGSQNRASIHLSYDPDDLPLFVDMIDKLSVTFVGVTLSSRSLNARKRNPFFASVAIGCIWYLNQKTLVYNYKMKGRTFGAGIDIGYDFTLNDYFALGIQGSFTWGLLRGYTLSDGTNSKLITLESGNYEDLSRIDLTVGLRFGK
ncbi:hypothetical protein LJC68_06500 [Bacteroidales bacterium OttesenSCG-928-B11]|nr:hypothetical protein [Bacteroidales bacterium OttesenSCG-928-E04]MDL2309421.1 hypothetical protein [Bacteroidales bacterium OttesenSCG-928-C03]MDL2312509.1 hypothetical protein [Bacteroidales bacterium OttesenSCG-928-B11]